MVSSLPLGNCLGVDFTEAHLVVSKLRALGISLGRLRACCEHAGDKRSNVVCPFTCFLLGLKRVHVKLRGANAWSQNSCGQSGRARRIWSQNIASGQMIMITVVNKEPESSDPTWLYAMAVSMLLVLKWTAKKEESLCLASFEYQGGEPGRLPNAAVILATRMVLLRMADVLGIVMQIVRLHSLKHAVVTQGLCSLLTCCCAPLRLRWEAL